MGHFLATSHCSKSRGQVLTCELGIFASKSSHRDQLWSLRLVPRIQTSLNSLEKSLQLVPQTATCELFLGQVPLCKFFWELVAGTMCADLKQKHFMSPYFRSIIDHWWRQNVVRTLKIIVHEAMAECVVDVLTTFWRRHQSVCPPIDHKC